MSRDVYDFDLANRAYALFTLAEKRRALEIMATLRFPSVADRFFEGVVRVIKQNANRPTRRGRRSATVAVAKLTSTTCCALLAISVASRASIRCWATPARAATGTANNARPNHD